MSENFMSKIKEVMSSKKYRPIIIGACVSVFIIVGVLVTYFVYLREDQAVDLVNRTPDNKITEEDGDLLPITERTDGEEQTLFDPFSSPAVLKGVLVSANSQAIIENAGNSYIVQEGDSIGDQWLVEKIQQSSVILKSGDQELVLELP